MTLTPMKNPPPQKLAVYLRKRTSSWTDALKLLHRNKVKLGSIALTLVALYFLRRGENALVPYKFAD